MPGRRRLVWALFASASIASLGHASIASPMSATPSVTELAAAFVTQSEQRDPLFADGIGIHTYDDSLDDYSTFGHAKRMAWLRGWHTRLRRGMAGASAG
ncbi:MAG: hypothetical protein IAI50_10860, partial [Candidatus Eremiobacteraeota bacterium]|nr:hypothetical protein [Candidatus Eremiobacteraeota bacterium]